ncbi:hypothetical protein H4R35_005732, partial [Dimargaris xerosporica]
GTKHDNDGDTNSLYGYGGDDSDGGHEPQIFKNQPDVSDDSRLFCANCEVFDQHWTEDCPNQDETF